MVDRCCAPPLLSLLCSHATCLSFKSIQSSNWYAGLEAHVSEATKQGFSTEYVAKFEKLSDVPEHSLAAMQQQNMIEMLQSVTSYLQQDMQLMQQETSDRLAAGKQTTHATSLLPFAAYHDHCIEYRRPWR